MISCSNDVEAPDLNRPQEVPYAACNDTGLDLRQLTEKSVRGFIDCINGPNGRVQAYQDFLEQLDSKELLVLLEVYNTHMVNESRFKKGLELYKKMMTEGEFDRLIRGFASLSDYGLIRQFLPLFKSLYDSEGAKSDAAIESLNAYIVKLIDVDQFTDTVFTAAKFTDSGRARLMAKLISQGSFLPGFDHNKVVEQLANAVDYGIQSGGFQEVAMLLFDPNNLQMFRKAIALSPKGLPQLNAYIEHLGLLDVSGDELRKLTELTRAADRPATCFESGSETRVIPNMFVMGFEEVKARKLKTESEIAQFYLQEVPFHLQNLKYQCDIPESLSRTYSSFTNILKAGHGLPLVAIEEAFDDHHRIRYLTDIMSSAQLGNILSLVANTGDRDVLAYLLDMLTRDISQEDFNNISQLVNYLFLEDLNFSETQKWLKTAWAMDENLRLELIQVHENTSLGLIGLLEFIDKSARNEDKFLKLSSSFRRYLAKLDFVNAPANLILPVIQKVVSPNGKARENLKNFVGKSLKLWASSEPGVGDVLAALSNSMEISKDRPIQLFLRGLLADKDFVKKVNPILLRLMDMDSFIGSIELTADLGKSGELSRLLGFLYGLAEPLALASLSSEPLGKEYLEFTGNAEDYLRDYSFIVAPLEADYSACSDILKHNGDWNSTYIRKLAECQSLGTGTPIDEVLSLLEGIVLEGGNNILDVLGQFASQEILRAPYFYPMLDKLRREYESGNLDLVFDLFADIRLGGGSLIQSMETLVVASCDNENQITNPRWLTNLSALPNKAEALSLLPHLLFAYKPSKIPELSLEPSPMDQDRIELAWLKFQASKNDIADKTWKGREEEYFQDLVNSYENRSSNYLYDGGVFERPPEDSIGRARFYSDSLSRLLQYAGRGSSVSALLLAIKDLEESDFPFVEFLDRATSDPKLIPFYTGKNKKPILRFANSLERAEILVQNSRLSIAKWLPEIGVKEVGSFFQLELANSKDRARTLRFLQQKVDLGLLYTKILKRKEKRNMMRNIDINFPVLENFEEQGFLRLFSTVYKHLVDATPRKDRVQSRERLYSSLVHEPMKQGVFTHFSDWYLRVKHTGFHQILLESVTEGLGRASLTELKSMEALVPKLLELDRNHDLFFRLYRYFDTQTNQLSTQEVFRFLSAFKSLPLDVRWVAKQLDYWADNPESIETTLSIVFELFFGKEGEVFRLVNYVETYSPSQAKAIKGLVSAVSGDELWLRSFVFEINNLALTEPQKIENMLVQLRAWRISNEQLEPQLEAFSNLLRNTADEALALSVGFFEKADYRDAGMALVCEVSRQNRSSEILHMLEELRNSKGFENVFKMLQKYFSP